MIPIGLGCGQLGAMTERDATRLIHAAIDLGVTVFDTAKSYGASESHVGRALRGRDAFVVTKGGYGVEGCADWTRECIARGVDRALSVLGRVDAFLLHSCPPRDDLVEPLVRARDAGKIGTIGYSGDGEGLAWAEGVEVFDVLECSMSLFDQRALPIVSRTKKRVLAKRALGNAVWRETQRPAREDRAVYWDRMRAMFDAPPSFETAVRFAAWSGVSHLLIGTTSESHLASAIEVARKGPLEEAREIRARFERHGATWSGLV